MPIQTCLWSMTDGLLTEPRDDPAAVERAWRHVTILHPPLNDSPQVERSSGQFGASEGLPQMAIRVSQADPATGTGTWRRWVRSSFACGTVRVRDNAELGRESAVMSLRLTLNFEDDCAPAPATVISRTDSPRQNLIRGPSARGCQGGWWSSHARLARVRRGT